MQMLMKETVHVNIGSEAFTLDCDAYGVLKGYLGDIRSRLSEAPEETMGDIESRIAELLREKVASPMRVVDLPAVRAAMAQMGAPSDFGECCEQAAAQEGKRCEPRRLYRSRTERAIAGVCGGLAEYFDADPTLFRLAALLLIPFGTLSIWVYVVLWVVIPEKPVRKFDLNNKKR